MFEFVFFSAAVIVAYSKSVWMLEELLSLLAKCSGDYASLSRRTKWESPSFIVFYLQVVFIAFISVSALENCTQAVGPPFSALAFSFDFLEFCRKCAFWTLHVHSARAASDPHMTPGVESHGLPWPGLNLTWVSELWSPSSGAKQKLV